jgi:drug/metabolite transporter (DMT)-like permease
MTTTLRPPVKADKTAKSAIGTTGSPAAPSAATQSTVDAAADASAQKRKLWLIIGAFAIVYLVWGSTYLAIRISLQSFPPFVLVGLRFVTAGLLMLSITRRQHPGRITARQWINATLVGTALLTAGNGMVCWAEQFVASGVVALLVATVPLWFMLLDWLVFRGPRPTVAIVSGIALGLLGIGVLLEPSSFRSAPVHAGAAMALVFGCIAWAGGSLFAKRIDLPKSPFVATGMEMVGGGAVALLVATLMGEWSRFAPAELTWPAIGAFGYLFVFGSMIAMTAYVWLLHQVSPTAISTYAFVNPVVAVTLGALFGETFSTRTAVAMSIIVLGVMVITLAPRRAKPRT